MKRSLLSSEISNIGSMSLPHTINANRQNVFQKDKRSGSLPNNSITWLFPHASIVTQTGWKHLYWADCEIVRRHVNWRGRPWENPGAAKANKMSMLPMTPNHAVVTSASAHFELTHEPHVRGWSKWTGWRTSPRIRPHELPEHLRFVSDAQTKQRSATESL